MFSTRWSAAEWAKQQYLFKMNANASMFTILIVLQIIGTIFISGASVTSTHSSEDYIPITFNFTTVSYDGQIGMTLFWAFVVGFLLTSAAQRNESFVFVTNRLTFQLANFYFICTAAVIGSITTVLLGSVMKIIILLSGNAIVETSGLFASPSDFFSRVAAMTGYTLLVLLLGYLAGTLIQWSKWFIVLFAALWFGMPSSAILVGGEYGFTPLSFFFNETSLILFILKVILASVLLFGISFFVTNRLEVRQ